MAYSSGATPQNLDHYTIAYETAWTHLVQQHESRFGDKAVVKPAEGIQTRFNQYSKRSFSAKTSRTPATATTDSSLPVRWAYAAPFDDAVIFDEWDEKFLGAVVLPTDATMQSQVFAWNRTKDSNFLANILGLGYKTTASAGSGYVGNGGTPAIVPVVFDSTMVIAKDYVPFGGSATTSGMTIAKIRKAKQLLDAQEVPAEGRFISLGAKEIADLYATTEVTNSLYRAIADLQNGALVSLFGFTVIHSELNPYYNATSETDYATNFTDAGLQNILNVTGNSSAVTYNNATDISSTGLKTCAAWQKDMVGIVDGGKKAYMDILPTQSHSLQIRATGVIGAARLQEKGVVAIISDQNA
jgi:hypothetical protein